MTSINLFKRPHRLLLARFFTRGLLAAILVTVLTGWILTLLVKNNYTQYIIGIAHERVSRVSERISHQMSGNMAGYIGQPGSTADSMMNNNMGAQVSPVQQLVETEIQYGSMLSLEVIDSTNSIIAAGDDKRIGSKNDLVEVEQARASQQVVTVLLESNGNTLLRYVAPIKVNEARYVVVVEEPLSKMESVLLTSRTAVTAMLTIGFGLTFSVLSLIVRRAGLDLEYHQQEESRVKDLLGRYVSHQVAQQILTSGGLTTDGERRQITVLFADIRGFTPFSEMLPPEQVVELLNDFLETMTEAVFKYDGTLDKFLGDGLMVIFGAPVYFQDDVERALNCAEEMQSGFGELKKKWQHHKYASQLSLGIGINSGDAVVGSIGSVRRLDYTAIGDVVNTAARLQSIASGGQILISGSTRQRLSGDRVVPLGEKQLKGKREAVATFAVREDFLA